ARYENWGEYLRRIEEWAYERSAAEAHRLLMEAGVPCSRYKKIDEAMAEPPFADRNSLGASSGGAGHNRTTNLPLAPDGEKPLVREKVHGLGEDTAQVLASWLGLTAQRVSELARQGVVAAR